ncbi:MAG: hypothetical protein IJN50_02890 [Clostridia bacterium]|nr:hypothetical protein [Clostridia bacterium]
MAQQKKKSDRYILKQKDKYAKLINKDQNFISAYQMAYKKGDLDVFMDFLEEVECSAEFVDRLLIDSLGNLEKEEKVALNEFAEKLGIRELNNRFGEDFGRKILQLYSEKKIKYIDIQQLLCINEKSKKLNTNGQLSKIEIETIRMEQAQQISELLDLFTNDELQVGIHRTGGSVSGAVIKKEGINLTGHLSSGAHESIDYKNIQTTLDKNISFYNRPGEAIRQICKGANYKNYMGIDDVDIILVGIPKKALVDNNREIILTDSSQPRLNPKYVLGHVSVNKNTNTINSIQMDDRMKERNHETINSGDYQKNDTEKWLQDLRRCTEVAIRQPEYEGIKGKLFKFFDMIRGKNSKTISEFDKQKNKDENTR